MYELFDDPGADSGVMVSALSGWVDAAGAGTAAAGYLAGEARLVARFDGDKLFDYRSQRPILDIVEGTMKRSVWPEVVVRHAEVGGIDLFLLTGQEPDLAWRGFSAAVADVAARLGVTQLVTFGAVPAAVPHTLPPPVMTTASEPGLLREDAHPPEGLLRVPAAAVSMVDQHVAEAGIPTVGFFVQVPHYVTSPYPAGVLELLRRLARHLDASIPLEDLEREAADHRRQLDEIVAEQPEASEHVRQLEEMAAQQESISGEALAGEIERFLREAGSGRGDDEGGGRHPG